MTGTEWLLGLLPLHDLTRFELRDMIQSGQELRRAGGSAACTEEAAAEIVNFFYDRFLNTEGGHPSLALVRCFKTHAYGSLPVELQNRVQEKMVLEGGGGDVSADMRCLTLLASRGWEPQWNGRRGLRRHGVIPLSSARIVEGVPMMSYMLREMRLEVAQLITLPDQQRCCMEQGCSEVFHVEEAEGCVHVPSQDAFVRPYGVKSVLGIGGLLPAGDFFVFVMFSKVRIGRETAAMFRTVALNVKLALLPFAGGRVFVEE